MKKPIKKPIKKDEKLFVRLPHELRYRLQAIAQDRGESEGLIVREALNYYTAALDAWNPVPGLAALPPHIAVAAEQAHKLLQEDAKKLRAKNAKP